MQLLVCGMYVGVLVEFQTPMGQKKVSFREVSSIQGCPY